MQPTDAEIEALVDALERERQAWISGLFEPKATGTVSQAADMTIFGPFGGELASNGPELDARQRRASAVFLGGTGRCDLERSFAAGDLLVLVMVERNEVTFEGRAEAHAWTLRTTQVFRREGDGWLRLHRHADPLIQHRSLHETLALL